MNPVVHFEMPADNMKRVSEFYTKVFGWKAQHMGNEYIVVATSESDQHGRPKQPGAINGGFFQKAGSPSQLPMVVIAVDDIKAHLMKIKEAGGEVLSEPVDIPEVGAYASFQDTEGNRVNLLQPSMR